MVAYSWGNGIEATTFNPKYAAFFNSTSSTRFGYISLVRLRFTDRLAVQLELARETDFVGSIQENVLADLRRLAERLAPQS
jgi:hypothetical protein